MSDEHDLGRQSERKPNRLINETSPYLRQHAYNPVDWYPWSEEAFARARAENKPVLLSIGYSACHWCHVMERESFEDETIARLANENFLAIKVDREERPDLDEIYMNAVQMMAGRGGWPLTVFLTPEGKPFYGGTYFPPEDRYGMPGFGRVLGAVARAWREQAPTVEENVRRLGQALGSLSEYRVAAGELRPDLVESAAGALARGYDPVHGGLGNAPKFPNSLAFSLLLRVGAARGGQDYAEMVRHTLAQMARGGIYDQLGGGFHRYSVDERWLVPHFEKMLYDNALLACLYLDAGRALEAPEFLSVAREILDYVLREMRSPEGGFYSTQDADSEGEEGKFFAWTPGEVRGVLGEELAKIAERYFDITEEGNFEGRTVLHRTIGQSEAARLFGMPEEQMAQRLAEIRRRLFAARELRVKPARDEKLLAAWNGLVIGALAQGFTALGEARYLDAAEMAATFLMSRMWDGRALRRSFKDGAARLNAYLEDYALVAGAMLDLYEAALDPRYLEYARTMGDIILERFLDRERGGFFFTSDDHETLITRSKAPFDGATPSGNSAAVMALLRLHTYTGEQRYLAEAERTLRLFAELMEREPFGFAHMLEAAGLYLAGPTEIVLVGRPGSAAIREWLSAVGALYVPNRALCLSDPAAPHGAFVPEQARGKPSVGDGVSAYVCRKRSCTPPLTSLDALRHELSR